MKKKTIILLTIITVVIGFLFTRDESDNAEIKPEFAEAKQGELMITVKERGILNAKEEITIKNKIPFGEITIINVIPDGSYVKANDFLIELDPLPLEEKKDALEARILTQKLALNEAENNLSITQSEVDSTIEAAKTAIYFAELNLEKFQTLDKQRQIDEQQSNIEEAKDQLNLSQQTYNASKTLVDKGFETTGKLEQDRLSLNSRNKRLKALEAKLDILIQYDLVEAEKRLTNVLAESQSRHKRMIKQGENKIAKAKAQVQSNQEQLIVSQSDLDELLGYLTFTKIHSEVEGYVLYPRSRRPNDRKMEAGQQVNRDQTLMRIPIMNDMKVDIEVAEHFISDVKIGQKTLVTIDSIKDKTFLGTVNKIALLPIQNNNWLGATVQKYQVEIDVDDAMLPKNIKPQISASAEIILSEIQDTLSVPIQAVHTVKGKQVVYVRSGLGSDYTECDVTIGKMETNFIEILSGLKKGDQVLISEPQI